MTSRLSSRSLRAGGPSPSERRYLFRVDTQGSPSGARRNARRAGLQVFAHVALHGRLGGFRGPALEQAIEESRSSAAHLRHLDHAVRTVIFTVTAADAGFIVDEDFTVRHAMNGRRRAILHAVRMLAVAARCGQVQ